MCKDKDKKCYVCGKKLGNKPFWAIGKDENGEELYRHKKCKPWDRKKK